METTRMVIDTSIFIDHIRSKDKSGKELSNLPRVQTVFASVLTVYELNSGEMKANRKHEIDILLADYDILEVNQAIAERAGEIYFDLKNRSQLIVTADILIAATCLVEKLLLKTRNIKDFIRIDGLQLV